MTTRDLRRAAAHEVDEESLTIDRFGDGSGEIQLALEAGNLDYDSASELGVVVNQYSGNITDAAQRNAADSSRSFIFDDATSSRPRSI